MSDHWASDRRCRCGHAERYHVAARYRCPVVDPRADTRCKCAEFTPADQPK